MPSHEPSRLRRGKELHRRVQEKWEIDAKGKVTREFPATKPSGRFGRIDIHIQVDECLSAVVEIKNSDWDSMASHRVRPNAKRYARQVWAYVESELSRGHKVSPGILFPRSPRIRGRRQVIETLFGEEGIAVAWLDE